MYLHIGCWIYIDGKDIFKSLYLEKVDRILLLLER